MLRARKKEDKICIYLNMPLRKLSTWYLLDQTVGRILSSERFKISLFLNDGK